MPHFRGIQEVTKMQIEKIPVDKLKAAEYNPRRALKPGDAEYEKLKRSIK